METAREGIGSIYCFFLEEALCFFPEEVADASPSPFEAGSAAAAGEAATYSSPYSRAMREGSCGA